MKKILRMLAVSIILGTTFVASCGRPSIANNQGDNTDNENPDNNNNNDNDFKYNNWLYNKRKKCKIQVSIISILFLLSSLVYWLRFLLWMIFSLK